jgi:hypothetical protein
MEMLGWLEGECVLDLDGDSDGDGDSGFGLDAGFDGDEAAEEAGGERGETDSSTGYRHRSMGERSEHPDASDDDVEPRQGKAARNAAAGGDGRGNLGGHCYYARQKRRLLRYFGPII